jgi:threonine dehydratase
VVDEILLVPERDMETAVSLLLQIEKTVAEGAGAAGLAALLAIRSGFKGRKVGLVLTGGNIDTRLLATVLLRDLARSGRMARLRIQLQDRPGALFSVVKLFEQHRSTSSRSITSASSPRCRPRTPFIDIECEARDAAQLERLVGDLEAGLQRPSGRDSLDASSRAERDGVNGFFLARPAFHRNAPPAA